MPVESPCVRNCCLDEQDICFGCFRSIAEIMLWGSASDDERRDILKNCEARREERRLSQLKREKVMTDFQTPDRNHLGQPIGFAVPNWKPPQRPPREVMEGRYCRLEPIDPARHAAALFEANRLDKDGRMWTYLSYGPFETLQEYRAWLDASCRGPDPMFFTIIVGGKPVGIASYSRINPAAGSIEVGHLAYSPALARTPAATEAMFLMMQLVFDLGYRRYEWKCNSLNEPSRAAAQRLGFSFEGIFRQSEVHKGRNRDTAWFSIIDSEWPQLQDAFEAWLTPDNFDAQGRQKIRLSSLTARMLKQRG